MNTSHTSHTRSSLGAKSSHPRGNTRPPCSKSHSPAPRTTSSQTQPETSQARKITEAAKREMIRNSQSTIKDSESAEKWLEDSTYIVKGETITAASLTMALLYIANGNITTYAKLIDGIRAVAICLGNIQAPEHTREAAETITQKAIETIEAAAEEMRDEIAGIAENCHRTIEEIREEERRGREEARREEKKAGKRREGEDEQRTDSGEAEQNQGEETEETPRSYAEAAKTKAKTSEKREETRTGEKISEEERKRRREVTEREGRRAKQILIDGIKNIETTTEGEIVEKANKALKEIEGIAEEELEVETGSIAGTGKFVAARKLKNGGVIVEANIDDVAIWLHAPRVKKTFEEAYGGGAEVKERLYSLIIEFISTSYKHSLSESTQRIETANDMGQGTIHQIRWMRDPAKSWGENQTKAHAILTTKDKLTANRIIKNSLIIDGRRHSARKIEDDPRRCFKCQRFDTGHTAARCPDEQACANCNETDHETGECRVHRDAHRCASCTAARRNNHHASWSRRCPIFIKHQRRLRDKFPENHYRYYPSECIPWTWEKKTDLAEEEEKEEKEGFGRWTGSYDGKRHEEARSGEWRERDRRRQEEARDNGYGQALGYGWNDDMPQRGDHYRPDYNHRSRSRGRGRGYGGAGRGDERGRGGGRSGSRREGEGAGRGRGESQGRKDQTTQGETTGKDSETRRGGDTSTQTTGASGSSTAATQGTIPASWTRQRANTTGDTRRSNEDTIANTHSATQ